MAFVEEDFEHGLYSRTKVATAISIQIFETISRGCLARSNFRVANLPSLAQVSCGAGLCIRQEHKGGGFLHRFKASQYMCLPEVFFVYLPFRTWTVY